MKRVYLWAALLFAWYGVQAQVAINETGDDPNPNAMLDVKSTTKGVLIPRMATADREGMNLTDTDTGMTVFDTDTKTYWYWDGTDWVQMGASDDNKDKDWYKTGTTEAPDSIADDVYHMGNVGIGKNSADTKLDVYDDSLSLLASFVNDNPDNSQYLVAGFFKAGGPINPPLQGAGKTGVFATTGGDPGTSYYASLSGFVSNIIGNNDDSSPTEYGIVNAVVGDNKGTHTGTFNYLAGGNTGTRYGVFNYMAGQGDGLIVGTYQHLANTGNGVHMGSFINLFNDGNGVQIGTWVRNSNSGNGQHYGFISTNRSTAAGGHVGSMNVLGADINDNNPKELRPVSNDSDGKRVGGINIIAGDGNGLHLAIGNSIFSTGNGNHVGVANVLGFDLTDSTVTSAGGKQVAVFNAIPDKGPAAHMAEVNTLGLIVDANNPTHPVPVSGDSNGKRLGELNIIGGDGGGIHITEINNIFSTGDSTHVGLANVLGYNFIDHTYTTTDGYHVGGMNVLTDIGNGEHYGQVNMLGVVIDPSDPTQPVPVTGDSDKKRIGTINVVGGDGAGEHAGETNVVISTGNGEHTAVANFVGFDPVNKAEIDSDGHHFGTVNLLAGGQASGNALAGLQIGTQNTIIAKSNAQVPVIAGRQYGTLNVIGRDPLDPFGTVYNNGDGDHFGTYNDVSDSGNGTHVGSYNVVANNGTGRHIAVYGRVDPDDPNAFAGYFHGDISARNSVSTINILAGERINNNDAVYTAYPDYSVAFNPVNHHYKGQVEVKVIVKISNLTGTTDDHKFRLVAENASGNATVVDDTATWTWTQLSGTNYIIESQWVPWNGGTDPWMLTFEVQNENNTNVTLNNVYIMVRPLQINGLP